MFSYQKKLQYPVKIDKPNPKLASIIISQYGGPDGELGASLRYLSQRYSMPFDELKGLLTDIGTVYPTWPRIIRLSPRLAYSFLGSDSLLRFLPSCFVILGFQLHHSIAPLHLC